MAGIITIYATSRPHAPPHLLNSNTANTCATGRQPRETAASGKFKACLRKLSPQTMPSTNCRGSWLSVSLSACLYLCLLSPLLPVSRLGCLSFCHYSLKASSNVLKLSEMLQNEPKTKYPSNADECRVRFHQPNQSHNLNR